MTLAEYIADQLFNAGVRKVFGIPGGPSIPYLEAFRRAGIEFILTSDEGSAGIMADVSGRITGIPGVCHATFGPGATNIATGIGGALLDRSPLIVLTSEIEDLYLQRTTQMNIDHQKLFEPVTKATFRLSRYNVHEVLGNALRICREEYPGPVHIGLPSDIAETEVDKGTEDFAQNKPVSYKNDNERIIFLLEGSRRPVLALGLTAARHKITDSLASFLDLYKIPVVITPMAKGLLPEDHPSYAGVLFHALSNCLDDIFQRADLVIGLGYDPVEYNYESWMPDVPLVHFNTKETDLPEGENVMQYTGPCEEWFEMLKHLNAGILSPGLAAVKAVRNEVTTIFNSFTLHFGPVNALKILQEELPADAIITSDVGSHLHLLGQYWEVHGYGRIIMTNGWSGMGFGIPAALAARIAIPESTVVCITGDGGFLMKAGELITARRYNLPVIVVVFSDGELNLIKLKQEWQNRAVYGTKLYDGDLFGAERFLGVRVLKALSEPGMRTAVKQALSLEEPVIINTVIDPDDYKWLIVKR